MMQSIARRALFTILLTGTALVSSAHAYEQQGSLAGNYLAGRSAVKLRDADEASNYLGRALEADQNNPQLVERLFLLELSEGRMEQAEEFATRVLGFNSQQRMAHIVLGLRDFRGRHYADARKNLQAAAYTPVGELTSNLLIAWSYAGEGDLTEALKALDKLDSNDSFANFKSLHSALIADYLGNSIRAEASYRKAFEEAGASLRVVQSYGNFLARNGRFDEAQKVYEAFLKAGDDNPLVLKALEGAKQKQKPEPFINTPGAGAAEALFSLATSMTDDQSIDVALLYARLALSFNADTPVMYTLLGDTYGDMQQYEKAVAAYEMVAKDSPLRVNADMEIAVSLQKLERKDEALARLKDVIARDPKNYDAIVTLGNIYRNNEDYANAAKVYDDAIALITQPVQANWRVFYYDGIAHERLKDWDMAEKRFRHALELSPDEPMVLNYLGYSMIEKRINLTEAMAMVKKAVDLRPNDGYIIDSLGWAYFQLGDYEEAMAHVERAVELLPADPIIAEHLGDVYWRIGRRLEAKFQWQHAKDNKPEPDDLKRIEGKIKDGLPDEVPVTPAQNGTTQNNG